MRATFFGIVSFLAVLAAVDQVGNNGRYTRSVLQFLENAIGL